MNALHYALIHNDLRSAEILLEHGADPNELPEQEEDGVTPMHLAAGQGLEATRLLLEFDGDPNVRSSDLSTPLHIAATWGDLAVVQLLVQNGGDPQLLDEDGCTPVDVAENSSHPECVEFLKHLTRLLAPASESSSPNYSCHTLSSGQDTLTSLDTLTSRFDESSAVTSCSPHHSLDHLSSSTSAQGRAGWKVTPEKLLLQKFIAARSPVSSAAATAAADLERCSASPHCDGEHQALPSCSWNDYDPRSSSRCGSVGAAIDILESHLQNHVWRGHEGTWDSGRPLCTTDARRPNCPRAFPHGSGVLLPDSRHSAQACSSGLGRRQQDESQTENPTPSTGRTCHSGLSPCCVPGESSMPCNALQHQRCQNVHVSRGKHSDRQRVYPGRLNVRDESGSQGRSLSQGSSYQYSPCRNLTTQPSCKETQTSFVEERESDRKREIMQGGDSIYYSKYFPPLTPKSLSSKSLLETNPARQGVGSGLLPGSHEHEDYTCPGRRNPAVMYVSGDGLWNVKESIQPGEIAGSPEKYTDESFTHNSSTLSGLPASLEESKEETCIYVDHCPLQDKDLKNMSNKLTHKRCESTALVKKRYELAGGDKDEHNQTVSVSPNAHRSRHNSRRSSMYTSSLNRQIEEHMMAREPVCLNVTSPDHPCLERKVPDMRPVETPPVTDGSKDLCQPGRRSSVESDCSCDTFVTCGEEPDYQRVVVRAEVDADGQTLRERVENPRHKILDSLENSSWSSHTLDNTVIGMENYTLGKISTARTKSSSELPETVRAACMRTAEESRLCQGRGQSQTESQHSWHPPTLPLVDDSDLITSDESFLERRQSRSARGNAVPVTDLGNLAASLENVSINGKKNQLRMTPKPSSSTLASSGRRSGIGAWGIDVRDIGPTLDADEDSDLSLQNSIHSSPDSQHRDLSPGSTSPGSRRSSIESAYSQSQVKEYLHTDHELGISFIERCVSSECSGSARSSLDSQLSGITTDSQSTQIYDWRQYSLQHQRPTSLPMVREEEEGEEESTPVPELLQRLSNAEIRQSLVAMGDDPGPVVASTRQAYLVRLASARRNPNMLAISTCKPGYSWELQKAMTGQLALDQVEELEARMVAPFQTSDSGGRCWREGTAKSSFNYLLLDPRVSRNLPLRAKHMSKSRASRNLPLRAKHMNKLEAFQTFIKAIFYVGKGKRARPYAHLYEAISQSQKPSKKASDKVRHILEIWRDGLGVVSLHCFQSVIPVEAYTREACMVDAISLTQLTNQKRGDYYGPASTWSAARRRTLGVFLLQRALQIFLAEGERQICPPDLRAGP